MEVFNSQVETADLKGQEFKSVSRCIYYFL
jgi:hypothetical protein